MVNKLNYKIAFIAAGWHKDLVDIATGSCRSKLAELGIDASENIQLFNVPGSLEIPLFAKKLAQSKKWDAIIGFGLVVDGGIYRHEFVAQAVLDGIMTVGLETEVPVLSVVLTPQKFDENSKSDIEFFKNHLVAKGIEAAQSTIKIVTEIKKI